MARIETGSTLVRYASAGECNLYHLSTKVAPLKPAPKKGVNPAGTHSVLLVEPANALCTQRRADKRDYSAQQDVPGRVLIPATCRAKKLFGQHAKC